MPQPGLSDAHISLALHPDHSSAVTATLAGPESSQNLARTALSYRGFHPIDLSTLVLARIDHDEPHYADQAAQALREVGATVEITPSLQEEIDTEWTYGNYPMPYLDRDEIREVSAEAQRIHDDIAAGRLTIHCHAHDGWTTVAVGTYQGGKSVHLHGENYLRQEAMDYESEAEAVADFHRQHSVAVRPGPAPLTDIERAAREALARPPANRPVPTLDPSIAPSEATSEAVLASVDAPGDHEALLADFFTKHDAWEKWRPHDETTIASHESLTLRVEFLHEALHGDDAWTIAAYESPVGERLWHATATPTTPVEIMRVLLDSLGSEDSWGQGTPTPVTEEDLAEASRPLDDAGWLLKVGSRLIDWAPPTAGHEAGLRFDTSAKQGSLLPAWTLWGGNTADSPDWAIRLSTYAPAALIQDVAFELAYGPGRWQPQSTAATAPSLPTKPVVARPSASAPRAAAKR
ncbi:MULTISPECIES: DUF317 domain-containing protein [Streptomyces]|uniref:DUF317 domain-containing protein n=1 Tax=Streptomyces TaxID=1883 RepID=UPI002256105E|nr:MULTISPECIES: DUF317 domain-containing protein [Streptomyces]MCX5275349.1 DUF317 domain-containing protein [Streptomyces virginiae]MCX5582960.1 DUF317 domain-containing protein [Streptomyces erythrochromogenes]